MDAINTRLRAVTVHTALPVRQIRWSLALLSLAFQLAASAPPLSPVVLAQTPEPPSDTASAPRDTVPPADTVRAAGHGLLAVGFAVFAVVALTAPAAFVLYSNPDTTQLAFWDDHISAYLTGGFIGQSREEGDRWGWAHSGSVEVLKNGIYAELRIENLYFPSHFQFQTLRAGYLLHPKPALAGGVTLGYRRARGDRVQNALEIGLPLAVGTQKGAFRLEPTYLISSAGVTWNYRLQMEFDVPKPLVAGFTFEAKPVRQGSSYFGTMTLLFGYRN